MLISQVLGARAPEDMEMPHLDSVLDPIESHVNGSRSLLLSNVVGDVVGCQIIRDHHGGRLGMAHFFQNRSDAFTVLSVVKQATSYEAFRCHPRSSTVHHR